LKREDTEPRRPRVDTCSGREMEATDGHIVCAATHGQRPREQEPEQERELEQEPVP
jgi:hypothetical protein